MLLLSLLIGGPAQQQQQEPLLAADAQVPIPSAPVQEPAARVQSEDVEMDSVVAAEGQRRSVAFGPPPNLSGA